MFDSIAPTYDLLNRVISLGMDGAWRRKALRVCLCDNPKNVIDLGTGTGDLALMLANATAPDVNIIGADFSMAMLRRARYRSKRKGVSLRLAAADAANLPFAAGSVDAVVTAFTVRNIPDLTGALKAAARVLKPGGRLVVLDMTPVGSGPLARLFRLYFHSVVPLIGRLVSRHPFAYEYLPRSVDAFPPAQEFADLISGSGFGNVTFSKLGMGSIALHTGIKQA